MADVEGVILAAGLSTRAGQWKMTLPLGDKMVIEHCIAGMVGWVDRVLVVAGFQAERLREVLAAYDQVVLVLNERYREGMFSSVRAGIAAVRAPRFFLLPGDYPLIDPAVYGQMLAAAGPVIVPMYAGQKGHPVLLDSRLIPQILALPAHETLRDYLARQPCSLVEVEDEGILLDLDTPADYQALLARQRRIAHLGDDRQDM